MAQKFGIPCGRPAATLDEDAYTAQDDSVQNGGGLLARLQGKWQVMVSTCRRFPSIVFIPILVFLIITGLGVFGVIAGEAVLQESRKDSALALANSTLFAFSITVQQASAPVLAVGVYLERQPHWPSFNMGFVNMAKTLQDQSDTSKNLSQLEVAPNGVVSALYPDVVGGMNLDLLACCGADAMREVASKRLMVDGPYDIQQENKEVLIASLPVFVNSSVPAPYPDPSWAFPSSTGACTDPACFDASTGLKWWGTVYNLIFLDALTTEPGTNIPSLNEGHWAYKLYRNSPGVTRPDSEQPVVAQRKPKQLTEPVKASIQIFNTTYKIEMQPEEGWLETWWPAVVVGVVLTSMVLSLMLFITLLSKRQNSWLLYSILPRGVVKTLRQGHNWSRRADCCVLFADVVGFTRITARMDPETVAALVSQLFSIFERLTLQHGMTKVDIIGDCFMAVSGMLEQESPEEGAVKGSRLALDMLSCTDGLVTQGGDPVQVRVGLHAGPVVAVVLGVQSPKLTIFGDVVNTCSRLQSTSLPACVQVSGSVVERLLAAGPKAKGLALSERGPVQLRNRGVVNTWWLLPAVATLDGSLTHTPPDEEAPEPHNAAGAASLAVMAAAQPNKEHVDGVVMLPPGLMRASVGTPTDMGITDHGRLSLQGVELVVRGNSRSTGYSGPYVGSLGGMGSRSGTGGDGSQGMMTGGSSAGPMPSPALLFEGMRHVSTSAAAAATAAATAASPAVGGHRTHSFTHAAGGGPSAGPDTPAGSAPVPASYSLASAGEVAGGVVMRGGAAGSTRTSADQRRPGSTDFASPRGGQGDALMPVPGAAGQPSPRLYPGEGSAPTRESIDDAGGGVSSEGHTLSGRASAQPWGVGPHHDTGELESLAPPSDGLAGVATLTGAGFGGVFRSRSGAGGSALPLERVDDAECELEECTLDPRSLSSFAAGVTSGMSGVTPAQRRSTSNSLTAGLRERSMSRLGPGSNIDLNALNPFTMTQGLAASRGSQQGLLAGLGPEGGGSLTRGVTDGGAPALLAASGEGDSPSRTPSNLSLAPVAVPCSRSGSVIKPPRMWERLGLTRSFTEARSATASGALDTSQPARLAGGQPKGSSLAAVVPAAAGETTHSSEEGAGGMQPAGSPSFMSRDAGRAAVPRSTPGYDLPSSDDVARAHVDPPPGSPRACRSLGGQLAASQPSYPPPGSAPEVHTSAQRVSAPQPAAQSQGGAIQGAASVASSFGRNMSSLTHRASVTSSSTWYGRKHRQPSRNSSREAFWNQSPDQLAGGSVLVYADRHTNGSDSNHPAGTPTYPAGGASGALGSLGMDTSANGRALPLATPRELPDTDPAQPDV